MGEPLLEFALALLNAGRGWEDRTRGASACKPQGLQVRAHLPCLPLLLGASSQSPWRPAVGQVDPAGCPHPNLPH